MGCGCEDVQGCVGVKLWEDARGVSGCGCECDGEVGKE